MFTKTAAWYDHIYAGKDYAREAGRVAELIRSHQRSSGRKLLDVACGTGGHLAHFASAFDAEGLDVDEALLETARQRLPSLRFHRADMCSFAIGHTFDAVTCLFSSIGYACTTERLSSAIQCFSDHLKPGGVLVLEPWLSPEKFTAGHVSLQSFQTDQMKIARMQRSTIENGLSVLNFDYLVGTRDAVHHFTERHELGLFTQGQVRAQLEACGLTVHFDEEGLIGRGLYIAVKAA